MLQYVVPFVIALVVSYALTPSVKKLAIKIGAVDRPNARKVHTHVIPRLGGLAIYIGFMAAVLFCVPLQHELVGMLLGCTAIVAVGIWDDICNIPAKVKLVGQILAACIPIAFGIQIEWLTNPFGDIIVLPELIAIPVTIFWIIGFTNTVNLIDGLDGLAAGVAFIASISMFLLAYNLNQFLPALVIVSVDEKKAAETCKNADPIIALSYLELYAASLGLGTVWDGFAVALAQHFPKIEAQFHIPKHCQLGFVMALGIPAVAYARTPQLKTDNVEITVQIGPFLSFAALQRVMAGINGWVDSFFCKFVK